MLSPVRAVSGISADYQIAVQPSTTRPAAAVPVAGDTAAEAPLSGGKLGVLSLSGQLLLARGSSVFAETIGAFLELPRGDDEPLTDYSLRLQAAVQALSAGDKATLENLLDRLVKGISLRLLDEILKNPTGPDAARLAMSMETAQADADDLAARAAVSSYRQNEAADVASGARASGTADARQPAAGAPAGQSAAAGQSASSGASDASRSLASGASGAAHSAAASASPTNPIAGAALAGTSAGPLGSATSPAALAANAEAANSSPADAGTGTAAGTSSTAAPSAGTSSAGAQAQGRQASASLASMTQASPQMQAPPFNPALTGIGAGGTVSAANGPAGGTETSPAFAHQSEAASSLADREGNPSGPRAGNASATTPASAGGLAQDRSAALFAAQPGTADAPADQSAAVRARAAGTVATASGQSGAAGTAASIMAVPALTSAKEAMLLARSIVEQAAGLALTNMLGDLLEDGGSPVPLPRLLSQAGRLTNQPAGAVDTLLQNLIAGGAADGGAATHQAAETAATLPRPTTPGTTHPASAVPFAADAALLAQVRPSAGEAAHAHPAAAERHDITASGLPVTPLPLPREALAYPYVPYPPEEDEPKQEGRKTKAISAIDDEEDDGQPQDRENFRQREEKRDDENATARDDAEVDGDQGTGEDAGPGEERDQDAANDHYWRLAGWA